MNIFAKKGNGAFLERSKTAFLSSRKAPSELDLVVKEWVMSLSPGTDCVMCGNLTATEKLVLRLLLDAKIPAILVLAEAMTEQFPFDEAEAIAEGRLLVVTHCDDSVHCVCAQSAQDRNYLMLSMADNIVVGNMSRGGNLERMLAGYDNVRLLMDDYLRDKRQKREKGIPVSGCLYDDTSAKESAWSRKIELSGGTLVMAFITAGGERIVKIEQTYSMTDSGVLRQKIMLNRTEAAAFCAVIDAVSKGERLLADSEGKPVVKSASGDVTIERIVSGRQDGYRFTQDKDLGLMGRRHEVINVGGSDFAAFCSLTDEMTRCWRL